VKLTNNSTVQGYSLAQAIEADRAVEAEQDFCEYSKLSGILVPPMSVILISTDKIPAGTVPPGHANASKHGTDDVVDERIFEDRDEESLEIVVEDTTADTDVDMTVVTNDKEEEERVEAMAKEYVHLIFKSDTKFSDRSDDWKTELRKQLRETVPSLLEDETTRKTLVCSARIGHNELKLFVSWHTSSADLMGKISASSNSRTSTVRVSRNMALEKLSITSEQNNEVIKAMGFYTPQAPKRKRT
jgi:hypothetical protein